MVIFFKGLLMVKGVGVLQMEKTGPYVCTKGVKA